jgi:hypothetical protein
MSKKTSIILILLVFILAFGWLLFNYFSNNNNQTDIQTEVTTEFPFGKTSTDSGGGASGVENQNNTSENIPSNNNRSTNENYLKLKQIYSKPISGLTFSSNKIKFVDRSSGNIYEYDTLKKEESKRITNTTIAKIQSTSWSKDNDSIILKFVDDENNINFFSGKIGTSTDGEVGEIKGNLLLTKNTIDSLINPAGDKVFELIKKIDRNGSYGTLSSINGENKKQIFDSPLFLFNIDWINENIITFTTKPSYKDSGFLYFFDIKNNTFNKIIGSIKGLTTNTNKNIDLLAYSNSINNSLSFDIYDIKTRENKKINIKTLSDKCIWSDNNSKHIYCAVPKNIPSANYPDEWYQGIVSFNDDFWMIDTEEGTTKLIYENSTDSGLTLDTFDLKLSSDDKYLAFTNKNDLSLWLLELPDTTTTIQ